MPDANPIMALATGETASVGKPASAVGRVDKGRQEDSAPGQVSRFLDWLGLGEAELSQAIPSVQTVTEDDRLNRLDWQRIQQARAKAVQAALVPTATPALEPAAVSPLTETEDRSDADTADRMADTLDSDDLTLLQQVLTAPQQLLGLYQPPALPLQQAVQELEGGLAAGVSSQAAGSLDQLFKWSAKTGRSIRVAIDDGLAVVLKIRQGRVSAEFLPNAGASQEVLNRLAALQSQLDSLKQRMVEQELPVDEVTARWRPYQQHQQEKRPQQEQASSH